MWEDPVCGGQHHSLGRGSWSGKSGETQLYAIRQAGECVFVFLCPWLWLWWDPLSEFPALTSPWGCAMLGLWAGIPLPPQDAFGWSTLSQQRESNYNPTCPPCAVKISFLIFLDSDFLPMHQALKFHYAYTTCLGRIYTSLSPASYPHPLIYLPPNFMFLFSSSLIHYIPTEVTPPFFPVLSQPPLSPRPILSLFPFKKQKKTNKKRAGFPGISTKQVTIRLLTSPHIKAGWGNSIGEKGSKEQPKESETPLLPLLRVLQEHPATQPWCICIGLSSDPCRVHDSHFSLCDP